MTEKETIILNRAEKVLRANCYPPNCYIWGSYRMISPSRGYFLGIWNWDSAFHAIGMIDFDIEIAKEQIIGFLQFQKEDGLLPDVIWEDGGIVDSFSKPPVMAYAAYRVFESCHDLRFLNEVYSKLVLNEKFWRKKRFCRGLFHYDADRTDGCSDKQYNQRVRYETGWDNSPRWDTEPQNLWPVDLNCFMVMTYRSLSKMAEALDLDAEEWKKKEIELTANIEKYLWNEKLRAYTDFDFVKHTSSDVLSPASFMPLFVEIAPKERAEDMNRIAQAHFLPGMPTVAYDNPEYSADYWRGPCWLNVAYFATMGLKNYGFTDTVRTVKSTIIEWLYHDGDTFHENYNSKTGAGQNKPNFSWSCVFAREFIKNMSTSNQEMDA